MQAASRRKLHAGTVATGMVSKGALDSSPAVCSQKTASTANNASPAYDDMLRERVCAPACWAARPPPWRSPRWALARLPGLPQQRSPRPLGPHRALVSICSKFISACLAIHCLTSHTCINLGCAVKVVTRSPGLDRTTIATPFMQRSCVNRLTLLASLPSCFALYQAASASEQRRLQQKQTAEADPALCCSSGVSAFRHDSPGNDTDCSVLLVERMCQLLPGGDEGSPLLVGLQHQGIPLLCPKHHVSIKGTL